MPVDKQAPASRGPHDRTSRSPNSHTRVIDTEQTSETTTELHRAVESAQHPTNMDLLKKAFTTPTKGEHDDMRRQMSPDHDASVDAPPEHKTGKMPATDAAIAALQGFTFDPSDSGTPATERTPGARYKDSDESSRPS